MRTNNLGDNAKNDAVEHIRPQSENKTETTTNRPEEADGRVLGTEENEDLELAPPSVRAAVLGKGDRKREEEARERERRK